MPLKVQEEENKGPSFNHLFIDAVEGAGFGESVCFIQDTDTIRATKGQ